MIYKRDRSPYWYAAFYIKDGSGKLIKRAFCTKTEDKDTAIEIEKSLRKATLDLAEKKRYENFFIKSAELMNKTVKPAEFPITLI